MAVHYAMDLPDGGGEDFFIHDGTQKDVVGFPIYTSWLPHAAEDLGLLPAAAGRRLHRLLAGLRQHQRRQPEQRRERHRRAVAGYQAGFAVVTSQEVANHAVSLSQYHAVLPLNGVDANLDRVPATPAARC